jgi:hypothetical protein
MNIIRSFNKYPSIILQSPSPRLFPLILSTKQNITINVPPHTSKRTKTSATESVEQGPSILPKALILEMPLEIWDEIMSYFPAVPIPYPRPSKNFNPVLPLRPSTALTLTSDVSGAILGTI